MRVCEIKKLVISNLSLEEKVELKNNGRPTPVLNLVQVQKECKSRPAFIRKFDKNIYDKTLWLCGCDETNRFFCFVCLLFGGGEENWTKTGVSDLKHLEIKIKKHENSPKHKNKLVSFLLLGRVNIASCLNSAYAEQINSK
uniref:Zinc finger protein n=1 Tax=Anoplophora glabripennis TaxID=217634 RepID=V5GS97_ANOGL